MIKLATITFYSHEEDEWGETTARKNQFGYFLAIAGQTIAVDPQVIPYGSWVKIPGLKEIAFDPEALFYAHDTGSAVKAKTASIKRGNDLPVIDVFMRVPKKELFTLNAKYGYELEYEII